MTGIIDVFLITGDPDDLLDYTKKFSLGKSLLKNSTLPLFYDSDSCLKTIQSFSETTKYRLWIHLGVPKAYDSLKEIDIKAFYEIEAFDNSNINYNFISRASKVQIEELTEKIKKFRPNFNGQIFNLLDAMKKGFNIEGAFINKIENMKSKNIEISINIVVINAIPAEQIPLLKIFPDEIKLDINISSKSQLFVRKFTNKNGVEKVIAFLSQEKMGMVDAAILASQAIEILKPSLIVMTGVCGGQKKLNYGDVIIPSQSFTFQFGKISGTSDKNMIFEPSLQDTDTGKLLHVFKNQIEDSEKKFLKQVQSLVYQDVDLRESIKTFNNKIVSKIEVLEDNDSPDFKKISELKNQKIDLSSFEIRVSGDMACSTSVIDVPEYFDKNIKTRSRDAIALEMESYAIGRACDLATYDVKSLIIKSVMDKTEGKNDTYKNFAAHTSAYTFYHLIMEGYI